MHRKIATAVGSLLLMVAAVAAGQESTEPWPVPEEESADTTAAPVDPPVADTVPVNSDAEPAAASATQLDDIVVTAQKRVQRVVDVPINVSSLSRNDIEKTRVEQVRDAAGYIPNLDIKEQVPGGIPVVSIRGVGLDDFSSTNSPAAGIYVDGVTLSSLALMSFDMYDMERLEVLKGPQGTLYGRNSTAGAINVITAPVENQSSGYVRAGYGSYQAKDLEAMYNLPIGDSFGVRVAGKLIRQDEGFWKSRVGPDADYAGSSSSYPATNPVVRDIGKRDLLQGRVRLAWDATPHLRLDLKVEGIRQRSEMGQPEMFGTMCQQGSQPIDPDNCTDALGYSDTDRDPYLGDYRGEFPYVIDQRSETLTLDWDLGWATLTAVSGHIDFERFFHIDVDGTPADEFEFLQGDTVSQFTHEARLAGSSVLGDWLGGVFYSRDTITINTDGLHQDLIPGEMSHIDADQDTDSVAAFGSMDWRLGRLFSLTTGLRYTQETRAYVGGSTWTVTVPGTLDNTHEDSSIDDRNWSWKLGLNFTPDNASLVYGSVSKGVKSGGYFAGVTNDQDQLAPYEPEELLAYEIGAKRAGLVALNASVFQYDYRNKQTFMRAGGAAAQFIGNVPEARISGGDIEATLRLFDSLTVGAGLGYLRTWLGAFVGPVDADMDGNGDPVPEGNELPNSPQLTWNALVRYELPVFETGLATALQVDAHYSDAAFKEATNDPLIRSEPYTVLNARASLFSAGREWDVSLWGRNLTDERYVSQGLDIATFFLGNRNYNAPRTWGLDASYHF